jgi:hypothetical protein
LQARGQLGLRCGREPDSSTALSRMRQPISSQTCVGGGGAGAFVETGNSIRGVHPRQQKKCRDKKPRRDIPVKAHQAIHYSIQNHGQKKTSSACFRASIAPAMRTRAARVAVFSTAGRISSPRNVVAIPLRSRLVLQAPSAGISILSCAEKCSVLSGKNKNAGIPRNAKRMIRMSRRHCRASRQFPLPSSGWP